MKLPGIGSHHAARSVTDEWLTPPEIIESLGPFDLDPCAPPVGERMWPTAARHVDVEEDGLSIGWEGRVWMNPPYSSIEPWMRRLAEHGSGTALVFARTETVWFFRWVWPHATGLLFLERRLNFWRPGADGPSKSSHNSGGPSVLIAYGGYDMERLRGCRLAGALVDRAEVRHGWRGSEPGDVAPGVGRPAGHEGADPKGARGGAPDRLFSG